MGGLPGALLRELHSKSSERVRDQVGWLRVEQRNKSNIDTEIQEVQHQPQIQRVPNSGPAPQTESSPSGKMPCSSELVTDNVARGLASCNQSSGPQLGDDVVKVVRLSTETKQATTFNREEQYQNHLKHLLQVQ